MPGIRPVSGFVMNYTASNFHRWAMAAKAGDPWFHRRITISMTRLHHPDQYEQTVPQVSPQHRTRGNFIHGVRR